MKKILAAAIGLTSVASLVLQAVPAHAFMLIDGEQVFGYDRNHSEVSLSPSFVPDPAPTFVAPAVFGNTSILDMMNRLKAEDQKIFLELVAHAGIRY